MKYLIRFDSDKELDPIRWYSDVATLTWFNIETKQYETEGVQIEQILRRLKAYSDRLSEVSGDILPTTEENEDA